MAQGAMAVVVNYGIIHFFNGYDNSTVTHGEIIKLGKIPLIILPKKLAMIVGVS